MLVLSSSLAILATTALSFASPLAPRDHTTSSTEKNVILKAHNAFRAKHTAKPLSYNPAAETYAAKLAATCSFQTPGKTFKYGQNTYATTVLPEDNGDASTIFSQAIKSWTDSLASYDYSRPGFQYNSGTGTQVVWAATSSIGCAAQVCDASALGFRGGSYGPDQVTFVVCAYDQPGNVQNEFLDNVKKN